MTEEKENKKGRRVHIGWVAAVLGAGYLAGTGVTYGFAHPILNDCIEERKELREGCEEILKPNEVKYLPIQSNIPAESCICVEPGEDGELKLMYTKNHAAYHR